jgi:cyclophilin family peptidyl-prolyl cis-trans isomerase
VGFIPGRQISAGGTSTVDLKAMFELDGVLGSIAQVKTSLGTINMELLESAAPQTVQNFLSYIEDASFTNLLVHRSVPGFVIQSGGFQATLPISPVPQKGFVVNEFGFSNVRGTVAMAKLGGDPDSATNQWFINLADNSSNLDSQNGGFTVFARVIGTGMDVADAIAGVPVFDAGEPFDQIPLRGMAPGQTTVTEANFVVIDSVQIVPVFPATGTDGSVLAFAVLNSNPAAASTEIDGSLLELRGIPGTGGTSTITITATDAHGNAATQTFLVTVPPIPAEIVLEHPAGKELPEGAASIDFGTLPTGLESAPRELIVRNTGGENLTIQSLAITGPNATEFTVVGSAGVLAPGASRSVLVRARPLSAGSRSASLWIDSDDSKKPRLEVALAASGEALDLTLLIGKAFDGILPPALTGLGTIQSMRNLPGGLRFDARSQTLVGKPTKAGPFTATFTILRDDKSKSTGTWNFEVESLPVWAVGNFFAMLEPPDPSDASPVGTGGWLKVTSTPVGAISGSLQLGAKRHAFRGFLEGVLESERGGDPLIARFTIPTDRRDPSRDLLLVLEFRPENHPTHPGLTGTLSYLAENLPIQPGWRQVWDMRANPAFDGKNRVLHAAMANAGSTGPQGDGIAVVKLNTAGVAAWTAVAADGTRVTGSFPVSPDGEIPLYAPLRYAGGGAFLGLLPTENVGGLLRVPNVAGAEGRWIKMPTPAKRADRLYRDGFDVDLDISGAEFVKPGRNEQLFGNIVPPTPLTLQFGGAGIASSTQLGAADPLGLAAELQPRNKLAVTEPNLPVRITPRFSAMTGLLSGRITLSDLNVFDNKKTARTFSYNGLYIPDLDDAASSAIRGFFLLPELPDEAGEKPTTTPVQSGALSIRP